MKSLLAGSALALLLGACGSPRDSRDTASNPGCANGAIDLGASASVAGLASTPLERAVEPVAADVNHFLFYGQSLAVGAGASGQKPLSKCEPYANLTFRGGPKSTKAGGTGWNPGLDSWKPLVEDKHTGDYPVDSGRGETVASGAANHVSELLVGEDGKDPSRHVILVSTAGHGGYTTEKLSKASAWMDHDDIPGAESSTNWYQVVIDQVTAANALARAQGKSYAVQAIGWMGGETDNTSKTPLATYKTELQQLRADIEADVKGITGQAGPVHMLVYQTSPNSAAVSGANNARMAHLQLAQEDPHFHFVAPLYQFTTPDGIHLTEDSYRWLGHYFGRAYKRLVIDHVRPQWINPRTATLAADSSITIHFDVPVPPLTLDDTMPGPTRDSGFRVVDANGTVPISNVAVDPGGTTVTLALARAPIASATVRYALDYAPAVVGQWFTNGAAGNLRDSEPASFTTAEGTTYPLWNASPHFELAVIPAPQ